VKKSIDGSGRIAPGVDSGTGRRPLLVAGTLSGIACLVLVLAWYRLAPWVSDRLFDPAGGCATPQGRCTVAPPDLPVGLEIAPHRWAGGLLVAFAGGLALLASGNVRSRCRISVKQYWAATLLLVLLSLAASFWMRTL
jgi:hypothetical protein